LVVEGHGEVLEEAERLVLVPPEPVDQIAHRALLAPPAASLALLAHGRFGRRLGWRRLGILGEPVAQERLIAGDDVVAHRRVEMGGAGGSGLLDGAASALGPRTGVDVTKAGNTRQAGMASVAWSLRRSCRPPPAVRIMRTLLPAVKWVLAYQTMVPLSTHIGTVQAEPEWRGRTV
jgi:hypothetical protein